ncbi:MAG: terminase small subunit [bacterium]|nr:terminase small subunit [bacterium]
MAKANEKAQKAKELYEIGKKLVDIANELDVPAGTVRRWKSTYKWEGEQCERSGKKTNKKSERSVKDERKEDKKHEPIDKEVREVLSNCELTDKQKLFCACYSRTKNAVQSYLNAYGGTYNTAGTEGHRLLKNPKIKAELDVLRRIKMENLLLSVDDVMSDLVDYHMRIVFADMGEYVEFGSKKEKIYTKSGVPIVDDNGEEVVTDVSYMKLNSSDQVDTQLIKEVTQGQNGVSIKLVDKGKSFDWLDKYFEVHPADRRKRDYDNKRLEMLGKDSGEDSNKGSKDLSELLKQRSERRGKIE